MSNRLSPADRKWLLKQLRKLRDEVRDDVNVALNEVIGEEARLIFLERMTRRENPVQ